MAEELKLLSTVISPFSMRVALALELKGIEYENVLEDLSNKSKLLLESNPVHKKIPVLLHKGKAIAESNIILEYLEDVWPEKYPLLPKDPYVRAQLRFWADVNDKKIWDSLFRFAKKKEGRNELNKEFIGNLALFEGALAQLSPEGPFFGGASLSFVDVVFAPTVVWTKAVAGELGLKLPSEEEYPRIHKLVAALAEHPSVKASIAPQEKLGAILVERFKK